MSAHRLVTICLATTYVGCAVVEPPGWEARRALPVEKIAAKPWVMYGVAPYRWVSALGEIEVKHASRQGWAGPRTTDLGFEVHFRGSPEPGLTCQMYVRADGPFAPYQETHGALFACVSEPRGVVFAEGTGCYYPAHLFFAPSCHQGVLLLGKERFVFAQGYLKRYGAPVGYLSFTSAQGELLGAADTVSDMRIALWTRPGRSGEELKRQRSVALLAVALHQFEHVTQERH